MKKQIVHISIHQSSKTLALFYFVFAAIIAMPWGIYTLLYPPAEGATASLALFIAPFLYLIMTYLASALLFFIYNLVAKSFGGIEFQLEDK